MCYKFDGIGLADRSVANLLGTACQFVSLGSIGRFQIQMLIFGVEICYSLEEAQKHSDPELVRPWAFNLLCIWVCPCNCG